MTAETPALPDVILITGAMAAGKSSLAQALAERLPRMALSLVAVLRRHGQVDQDALATSFAARHDPARGYGAGALRLLRRVKGGQDWRTVSADLSGGQGVQR
ncbi:hypothetical protein K2Z83_18460 [Oscillochloris sp. ZM17-4]|uniref:hypothetical protein n=1 Tax=Oscillochloris sp. ZM17-4 TaxID=2866714 RepID=UPI001C73D2A7|nr:hypothetical protein [Oscillochloris sp. ZM17-4]MBX0329657.1 hypothetical protein [Oscillochloris sp. ZM17-4]